MMKSKMTEQQKNKKIIDDWLRESKEQGPLSSDDLFRMNAEQQRKLRNPSPQPVKNTPYPAKSPVQAPRDVNQMTQAQRDKIVNDWMKADLTEISAPRQQELYRPQPVKNNLYPTKSPVQAPRDVNRMTQAQRDKIINDWMKADLTEISAPRQQELYSPQPMVQMNKSVGAGSPQVLINEPQKRMPQFTGYDLKKGKLDDTIKTKKPAEKNGAKIEFSAEKELNKILDEQYPLFRTVDIQDTTKQDPNIPYGKAEFAIGQNILGNIADKRLTRVFDTIKTNKDVIQAAAQEYGVPEEIVAAVILKEQYTQSAPDEIILGLQKLGYKGGSTGLGAIQARTAKAAWDFYPNSAFENQMGEDVKVQNNQKISEALAADDDLNIRTIAAILGYNANLDGYTKEQLSQLTPEQWWSAIKRYNGTNEKAAGYADKVVEYLPYMKELLE